MCDNLISVSLPGTKTGSVSSHDTVSGESGMGTRGAGDAVVAVSKRIALIIKVNWLVPIASVA